jgi:hypothetical protein
MPEAMGVVRLSLEIGLVLIASIGVFGIKRLRLHQRRMAF